jgi:malonyl CoA-acyl carrier protein transacylase
MTNPKAVAVVGLGTILPDAPDVPFFWKNIKEGRYSITEVPAGRWNPAIYFDPDPKAPDKSYTKIGAWVKNYEFEPLKWGIPIPPRLMETMDLAQIWAIAAARQALTDYGYPQKALDPTRVAVILGNAMGGEEHYNSSLRIRSAELVHDLRNVAAFQRLPLEIQQELLQGMETQMASHLRRVTEDTMPGELSNIMAGRVANVFNFSGPNFITDAACASSLAALQAAIEGLTSHQFDAVLTGGVDHSMGPESFVKFSKIGALSPDGSRPYAAGANGFVMGEGAAIFLIKRLEDAEKAGDRIYAVIRGVGGSSDGRGKGITAPNPLGQQRAIERAWQNAGVSPATAGLIEGHGTSTRVGDLAEITSMNTVFSSLGLPIGSIALGSVKSNIGHLKSAAGAVGLLKAVLALHEKVLPPNANFDQPNPQIDFAHMPFRVNTELRPWEKPAGEIRRAGISSFGFGGTNFHVVAEEYVPGISSDSMQVFHGTNIKTTSPQQDNTPMPYGSMLFLGADSPAQLKIQLSQALEHNRLNAASTSRFPSSEELDHQERLVFAYASPEELQTLGQKALKALDNESPAMWQALAAQGVFRGSGQPGKLAFLFPGQGSQYVNMLRDLRDVEPIVADTFREADEIMTPILGRPLTSFVYVEGDEASLKQGEENLRNTAITQPVVLTANVALLRVLKKFGFKPDLAIGHSLGEYAALVAAEVLTFAEALEVVSARGREMSRVSMEDNGCMAAVSAPIEETERLLKSVTGYVVIANVNSPVQSVIGGATASVEAAIAVCKEAGYQAVKIPVSHAFHTRIVAPASEPMRQVISRMNVQSPRLPVVANVTGQLYPGGREEILDLLASQVASPVQFIKGVETLYENGARTFIEVGPKRVLNALATDILKNHAGVTVMATNHPRKGGAPSMHDALCGLLAAGYKPSSSIALAAGAAYPVEISQPAPAEKPLPACDTAEIQSFVLNLVSEKTGYPAEMLDLGLDLEADLGIDTVKQAELFAAVREHYGIPRREDLRLADYNTLQKVIEFVLNSSPSPTPQTAPVQAQERPEPISKTQPDSPVSENAISPDPVPAHMGISGSVVVSGAGLGLPGRHGHVFQEDNIERILRGDTFIEPLPEETRQTMLDRRVTRLQKSEAGAQMVAIDDMDQTIKLAGQHGEFDPLAEFGLSESLVASTDISTQLAIAAGVEALRDAGIPLLMTYKTTSTGGLLPNRWMLPPALADETGVIFCSAFPGLERMAEEADRFYAHQNLTTQLDELRRLHNLAVEGTELHKSISDRITALENQIQGLDYHFDRRFIFRILSMGHSQFAEYIGARGPNTAVNAACATTTHAISIAEDWIRTGRCRRVVVIAGDDVTDGHLVSWIGTGLLATGATTTEGDLRQAALPFDRRRNGMIMGMGAAALVVEAEDAVRERGMRGIAEVLSTQIANSAFHGTRLDVNHVSEVMERVVAQAEKRFGIQRGDLAGQALFMSHETYTPARGGSAAAEIFALRHAFGEHANQLVIANTKGFTGHTMAVGIEDVVAIKALERGIVPPIAHLDDQFEPDPGLGDLNLSHGGNYPVHYALRLGAGFGSQIAMALYRVIPGLGERKNPEVYQRWLDAVSGYQGANLEVQQHTLRIQHTGIPLHTPAASRWQFGQGPSLWAAAPDQMTSDRPAVEKAPVAHPESSIPAVAPVPAAVCSSTNLDSEEIKSYVLGLVAEKTGYPVEMLDVGLDLEADLGIDTVKQAELFASVREHYGIPRREDLRLVDYNTLQKVIQFVIDSSASPVSEATPARVAEATAPEAVSPSTFETGMTSQQSNQVEEEEIKTFVLGLVGEKTGYPVEMLDPGLDLEADLGIDTVKQAELFASVRENYGIPRREDLRLADYNTLQKVVQFVIDEKSSAVEAAIETLPEPAVQAEQAPSAEIVRRIPVPVLRPRLDLCQPTSVVLSAGTRILVIADRGKVAEALVRKLRSLKVEVVIQKTGSKKDIRALVEDRPVDGVYFLPALDEETVLDELSSEQWQTLLEERLFRLASLMQTLPNQPFLITATRCGGLNGYETQGASAPSGGLVNGFTKALAWERPQSLIKTVDFERDASKTDLVNHLLGETGFDPAVVEVGWKGSQRFGFLLVERPVDPEITPQLPAQPVFLVSGGTAGIIAPVVIDLARHTQGRFYLLGRNPLPDPEHPDLALLKKDRSELKKELMRRLAAESAKPSPVQVEEKLAALDRASATLRLLDEVALAGGSAEYLVCDVTKPQAVEQNVEKVLAAAGRIDVFIHAAGVEFSRRLENKKAVEIEQTLAVKATGFFNFYRSLVNHQALPGHILAFSSVAGRFGNSGQTDYSAANDLVCRMVSALRHLHPEVKAQVIDWGAWGEVGMASRGHIPELMKRAGIELLSPSLAAPTVYRELAFAPAGEVVLAGALGALERSVRSGVVLDLEKTNAALTQGAPIHVMLSRVTGYDPIDGVVMEAELDPEREPFLKDHALNGIPLLPGVMGIEGFSVAAQHISSMLGAEKGSFRVSRLENIHFLAPFKFYHNQPRKVTWKARVIRIDEDLVISVTLESVLAIKHLSVEPVQHFSGCVHLKPVDAPVDAPVLQPPHWNGAYTVQPDDIYRLYFHGPAFQVLAGVQRCGDSVLGRMSADLPPFTSQAGEMTTSPLLVELALQTAGIWEAGSTGVLALPSSIGRMTLYRPVVSEAPIFAEVTPAGSADGQLSFNARVMDGEGHLYVELEDYRTTPLPYTVEQDLIDPIRALLN